MEPGMQTRARRAYSFAQVDVFTRTAFSGNPLAVFLDGRGLSGQEMQLIAREMNLSETSFILPPTRDDCAARVRIFTPGAELPFAGHPTVGTTFVLATRGMLPPGARDVNLEEVIGPVPVRIEGDLAAPDFIWMGHRPAVFSPAPVERRALAAALGLAETDLLPTVPLEIGSTGVPFLYAALPDPAAVDRAVLNAALLTDLLGHGGPDGVFIVAPTGDPGRVYSRMFAAGTLGIPEDPATGAASGPLGPFLLRHGLLARSDRVEFISEQGTKMGRQSFIHVRLTRAAGEDYGIEIGGSAVPILEGTLYLD